MKRIPTLLAIMLLVATGCGGTDDGVADSTTLAVAATTTSTQTPPPASSTTTTPTPETTAGPAAPAIQLDTDISYGQHGRNVLDVMYRDDLVDAPTILVIHGGGWSEGDKADEHPLAEFFIDHGFVVALPNYRLVDDEGLNAFPAAINDVACAGAWLEAHAADYGGDPATMLVTGYSAGGHLAAMLAFNPEGRWLEGCPTQIDEVDFDGFIGFAGPYDFETLLPNNEACSFLRSLIGPDCPEDDPTLWAEANPIDLVTADDPPSLLVAGDQDCLISTFDPDTGKCTASIDRMRAALAEQRVPVDVAFIPDGGHGDMSIDLPPIAAAVTSFVQSLGIPTTAATPAAAEPTFDKMEDPAGALSGVWFTSSNHPLALQADGSWSLLAQIVRLPWTWGAYTLDGDLLTLQTAEDAELLCHGTTGTYRVAVSVDEAMVHFTVVDDPCEARVLELAGGPYERVPDMLVPGSLKDN